MDKEKKENKKVLSHEAIYRIMQWLPVAAASVFFVINVFKKNTSAMLVIGICLAVLIGFYIFAGVRQISLYHKEYIMAVAIPVLVFVISLFSGDSYNDDFPLFLAVIAMTGLYLEPQFTRTQFVLVDIFFVILYLVHPEKAGSLSQYILCAACFTLAAVLLYQVIKRGRAFIEISQERAEESEKLLASIRNMGAELQSDFDRSSDKIEVSTQGLQKGSVEITHSAGQVSDSCEVVREKIKETEEQLTQLNEGVRQFENALAENKENVAAMNTQVDTVNDVIGESEAVFENMKEQMREVVGIAKQINDISFKLTILSLNASVEAARAGETGAGFEVLANEMRELSESSTGFSDQVAAVVKGLSQRVEETTERFDGSRRALAASEQTMSELADSFERLNRQFEVLYENIESQNRNVNQIEDIFSELNQKVSLMHGSSRDNQEAVSAIVDAMTTFSGNVGRIVKNTQSI